MKALFLILLTAVVVCFACEAGTEKKKPVAPTAAPQPEPSLAAYTDTLQKLPKDAPGVIEQAVVLYDVLAPHDSTGADSAASALIGFVQVVVKKENDSFHQSNTDFLPLLNPSNNTLTERQKALRSNLHANRLKLVRDGEGGVYIVPSYETILPTIKARTSEPVDNYLNLLAKEDTTPVFMDAGLAIEMTELVDRLVLSEQLRNDSLPIRFAAGVAQLNDFYTNALINGADNSPSIAFDSTALTEDFQKAYAYLLAKYPSSKAAAKINVWQTVVASGDKKKVEDYQRSVQ